MSNILEDLDAYDFAMINEDEAAQDIRPLNSENSGRYDNSNEPAMIDDHTPTGDGGTTNQQSEVPPEQDGRESDHEFTFQYPSSLPPPTSTPAVGSQTVPPQTSLSSPSHISVDKGNLIGESACETVLRLSNEFSPMEERDADTLLYIGPPPQATGQDDYTYAYVEKHFYKPYLMRSDTLKALNSPKFNKFLGPMSARTERKLKKLGIHTRINTTTKIKYYIDLRPMLDDDEALIMLTELSSTQGVLTWHQNSHKYSIPPEITCGSDDLNVPPKPKYEVSMHDGDENTQPIDEQEFQPISVYPNDFDENGRSPNFPNVQRRGTSLQASANRLRELRERPPGEDYSSLRHHSALERLLHAIAGNDPKLDSAPKAWTFFAIAKFFGCANSPRINHWLTTWLLRENNDNFIQTNPEVVYRMALGMQMPDMIRCTFAMLVGEKALLQVHNPTEAHQAKQSTHGRRLGLLDDDDINRVDHAAPSLLHRVTGFFSQITDSKLIWASTTEQISRLNRIEVCNEQQQDVLDYAKDCLQSYVRRQIFHALLEVPTGRPDVTTEAFHTNRKTYGNLSLASRLLTKSFWTQLLEHQFTAAEGLASATKSWARMRQCLNDEGLLDNSRPFAFVSRKTLFESFERLNELLWKDGELPQEFRNECRDMFRTDPQGFDDYGRPIRPRLPLLDEDFFERQPEHPLGTKPEDKEDPLYYHPDITEIEQRDTDWKQPEERFEGLRRRILSDKKEKQEIESLQTFVSQNRQEIEPEATKWWETTAKIEEVDKHPDEEDPWWWLPTGGTGLSDLSKSLQPPKKDATPSHATETDRILPIREKDQRVQAERVKEGYAVETRAALQQPCTETPQTDNISTATSARAQVLELRQKSSAGHEQPEATDLEMGHATKKRVSFGATSNIPVAIPLHPYHAPIRDAPPTQDQENHATSGDTFSRALPGSTYVYPNVPPTVPNPNLEAKRLLRVHSDWQDQKSPKRDYNPVKSMYRLYPNSFRNLIVLPTLLSELTFCLHKLIDSYILTPGYVADNTCDIGIPSTDLDILQCLTEDEWKYLPLWAGGLDDGSGGVFANDDLGLGVGGSVPDALDVGEGGFRGGPTAGLLSSGAPTEVTMVDVDDFSVVHRGVGVGESAGVSVAGDEFEEIKTDEGISTVGKASRIATDGTREDGKDGASTVMSLDE